MASTQKHGSWASNVVSQQPSSSAFYEPGMPMVPRAYIYGETFQLHLTFLRTIYPSLLGGHQPPNTYTSCRIKPKALHPLVLFLPYKGNHPQQTLHIQQIYRTSTHLANSRTLSLLGFLSMFDHFSRNQALYIFSRQDIQSFHLSLAELL